MVWAPREPEGAERAGPEDRLERGILSVYEMRFAEAKKV